jgi:hypothetical protein
MDRNVALGASADASLDVVNVIEGGEQTVHSDGPVEDLAQAQDSNQPALLSAVDGAPRAQMPDSEMPRPSTAPAPGQEPVESDGDAFAFEPLGVYQGDVGSTAFLDRSLGGDFGMGQGLGMAAFSAQAGSSAEHQGIAEEPERHDAFVGEQDEAGENRPPTVRQTSSWLR